MAESSTSDKPTDAPGTEQPINAGMVLNAINRGGDLEDEIVKEYQGINYRYISYAGDHPAPQEIETEYIVDRLTLPGLDGGYYRQMGGVPIAKGDTDRPNMVIGDRMIGDALQQTRTFEHAHPESALDKRKTKPSSFWSFFQKRK